MGNTVHIAGRGLVVRQLRILVSQFRVLRTGTRSEIRPDNMYQPLALIAKNILQINDMSYYFIAQIKINDDVEYQKYIDKAGEIFKKYNGEYLSVDNSPVILEGKWDYTRTVLIKFKSKNDFENWYNSSEYKEILAHRLKAADCDTILTKGLDK